MLRYNIGRLSIPEVSKAAVSSFDTLFQASDFSTLTDVDALNHTIVSICQKVSSTVLGLKRPSYRLQKRTSTRLRSEGKVKEKAAPQLLTYQPSPELAIRLYKSVAAGSTENNPILPSPEARSQGLTALHENFSVLRDRYSTTPAVPDNLSRPVLSRPVLSLTESPECFTGDQIAAEIKSQSASKGCGIDGIHIRLVKTLLETPLLDLLCRLYNLCLTSRVTPRAWNETSIHLLPKGKDLPKDVHNLRPITLICIFRKIFERLLLSRFDGQGWARLHSTQAGFRSHYSTCVNAAVVHHALTTSSRPIAIFLDFRSAFDVVDHSKLATMLSSRGCPPYLLALVFGLTFRDVTSRVVVNGELSRPFKRTCGVLQGSPISPLLFNLFIDGLLYLLNTDSKPGEPPDALFYADDGTLLARDYGHARSLLHRLTAWCEEAGISLNVKKCGHISAVDHPDRVFLSSGEEIPLVREYKYLGFPVTARGIDFAAHLRCRMSDAVGRSNFLGLYSNDWGVACRLHVYRQYLAPMIEYGAPLVIAWMKGNRANRIAFDSATSDFKSLLGWIGNCGSKTYLVAANLCGLTDLHTRFQHLHTSYIPIVDRFPPDSPLKVLIRSRTSPFISALFTNKTWETFKATSNFEPTVTKALHRHLSQLKCDVIKKKATQNHLLQIIPFESRKVLGLRFADITLSAPIPFQEMLFKYRQGRFMFSTACRCLETDKGRLSSKFRRAHEKCPTLPQPVYLTKRELVEKATMKAALPISDTECHFTDVDYLLNTKQFDRAILILSTVKQSLFAFYHETMKAVETFSP